MTGPYDDIIHLPHPVSDVHPRMSAANRAAQFSPFAALSGYGSAIQETARLTEDPIVLSDSALAELDMKLSMLEDSIADRPEVTVTYFVPDSRKKGGAYVTVNGRVKRIDTCEKAILFTDGRQIAIEDTIEIACDLFKAIL